MSLLQAHDFVQGNSCCTWVWRFCR